MKPTEFIVEASQIAQEADNMHADHEVQMARSDCYSAAKYAIELHRMLKQVSEQQGLDGWVSEKITLANDYLRTVHEYLMHEMAHGQEQAMMGFTAEAAEYAFDQLLVEDDYDDAVKDYFSRGGQVEKLPAKKPRKSEKTDFSSKHISGKGEVGRGKATRIGKAAKTDPKGKPVVTAEGLDPNKRARLDDLIYQYRDATDPESYYDLDDERGDPDLIITQIRQEFGNNIANKIEAGAEKMHFGRQHHSIGIYDPYDWKRSPRVTQSGKINKQDSDTMKRGIKSKLGVAEGNQKTMSRAAKGNEKYGKDGMKALAKAGREGASEKELDAIRDRHDRYNESRQVSEMATGGGSSAGGIATSMGGPGHKPTSGVPKKVGNAHKPKKIAVGKGVY